MMGKRHRKDKSSNKKGKNIALKRFGQILTVGMIGVIYLMIAAASQSAIASQAVLYFFATLGHTFTYWDVASATFIVIVIGGISYIAIARPK